MRPIANSAGRLLCGLRRTPCHHSCSRRAGSTTPPRGRRDGALYQAPIEAPRQYGPQLDDFTPRPLPRPIGMLDPPRPGDNSGVDTRTAAERRADFLDREKNKEKRRELINKLNRPYFRDWTNLRAHEGKSFLAPPRLFREDLALYFPNLRGETLARGSGRDRPDDTTPVLRGRTSVVAVFSSTWAENQTFTFVGDRMNPDLDRVLQRYEEDPDGTGAPAVPRAPQILRINLEENWAKAWLVRMFRWHHRRLFRPCDWGKVFLVTRGITEEIRESIGLLNGKVGYVYLVDDQCRIRWAGSGRADPEEKLSLAAGVQRLVEEGGKRRKDADADADVDADAGVRAGRGVGPSK